MPRIGIIGAGGIGRKHAEAYSRIPNARVIGVADPDQERVQGLAERCSATPYSSIDDLLAAERPDVLDICVPTPAHLAMALKAVEAKIPTILEKPVARHMEDARRIVTAFREAGVPMLPAHVVRFFPDFYDAREQVLAGRVGTPAVVRVTRGGPFPLGYKGWYGDPDQSGGALIDLMLHDFDWLRWTFGDVERVTACSLMAQGTRGKDYALAVLRMRSGVIAHVEGTWAHTDGFRTELEVSGDKGVLEHTSQFPFAFRLRRDEGETRAAVAIPESPVLIEPYTAELSELLNALTTGSPARVTPEDGLAALEIGLACWRSAETGRPVELPL